MLGTDHMQPPPHLSRHRLCGPNAAKGARDPFHAASLYRSPPFLPGITQPALVLPVVTGELRACKRMHLLPGVLSTRMWIKQRNHACENLLTRWVEPFSTFASLVRTKKGLPNPANTIRQPPAIIHQAWRC